MTKPNCSLLCVTGTRPRVSVILVSRLRLSPISAYLVFMPYTKPTREFVLKNHKMVELGCRVSNWGGGDTVLWRSFPRLVRSVPPWTWYPLGQNRINGLKYTIQFNPCVVIRADSRLQIYAYLCIFLLPDSRIKSRLVGCSNQQTALKPLQWC